ncbi:hypothetical protein OG735_00565 [Streptomyces sp. NBC_01210]|nr:hypothetical protein OG735_00565 [Streptomyces sp. NBC_01210]
MITPRTARPLNHPCAIFFAAGLHGQAFITVSVYGSILVGADRLESPVMIKPVTARPLNDLHAILDTSAWDSKALIRLLVYHLVVLNVTSESFLKLPLMVFPTPASPLD